MENIFYLKIKYMLCFKFETKAINFLTLLSMNKEFKTDLAEQFSRNYKKNKMGNHIRVGQLFRTFYLGN